MITIALTATCSRLQLLTTEIYPTLNDLLASHATGMVSSLLVGPANRTPTSFRRQRYGGSRHEIRAVCIPGTTPEYFLFNMTLTLKRILQLYWSWSIVLARWVDYPYRDFACCRLPYMHRTGLSSPQLEFL